MTRQKKELEKKINEAYEFIDADMELGCGFAPAGAYDSVYQKIHSWEEELAHLKHFSCFAEMDNYEEGIYFDVMCGRR